MNPLSLRTFSVNNFTSSITSKMVPFGNSYSTLTKIWSEKGCETTYQRWFSRAVIKTTMTGIRSAGPFPSLFPRAHRWKDLIPKWFASSAIISADSFRKCISCLKCILITLCYRKELRLYGTKWKLLFFLEALVAMAQLCSQGLCCCSVVWKGSVDTVCCPRDFRVGGCWDGHGSLLSYRWESH